MRWFRKGERKAETDNVRELISRRQYARALELLRASLQKKPSDRRLRLELSETLILSGQATQAVEVLLPLADDLVRQGFIGQARVVLKRAQDLEPGRSDVEERLDALEEIRRGSEYRRPAGMPKVIGEAPAAEPPEPLPPPGEDEAVPTPDTADAPPAEPARVVASVEDNDVEIPLDDVLDSSDTGSDMDGRVPESRLLRALSPEVAAALMSELRPLSCEPGEIVITEGEQAHSLHLIESGSVLVSVKDKAGRNVKVRSLEAGDFFGEIAALT